MPQRGPSMSTISILLRQHVDSWRPALTGLLMGNMIGLCLASTLANVSLDAGVTQLVGSAIGAGIAALAAIMIARHQTGAPDRNYERFIADSALGIRDDAYVLKKICEIEAWDSKAQWGAALRTQVNALRDVITLFQGNAPFGGTTNYKVRLKCVELDRALRLEERSLQKELKWLDTPTAQVLQNARLTLTAVCDRMLEATEIFSDALRFSRPLPTNEVVDRRVVDLQDEFEG